MFEQTIVIKSAADIESWIRAIVLSVRAGKHVSHPDDCADIVKHLAAAGARISLPEASGFWEAYSMSVGARWASSRVDCIAALDSLADEIENGWCTVPNLRPLRGRVRSQRASGRPCGASWTPVGSHGATGLLN